MRSVNIRIVEMDIGLMANNAMMVIQYQEMVVLIV